MSLSVSHIQHPRRARLLAVAVLSTGLSLGGIAAQAHVTARADSTTAGSFGAVTLRVPNESPKTSTIRVSVELPQDTPLLYVSSKPVPGWRAVTTEAQLAKPVESYGTTITKAVRTVTWSADPGQGIAPGEYQEFSLSVGPLPGAGPLVLPTEQTYSDGEVVEWKEPTPPSGAEPEHPVPELAITAATDPAASDPAASDPAASTPASTSPAAANEASASDGTARGLAGGGLALALAALVVAVASYRRKAALTP